MNTILLLSLVLVSFSLAVEGGRKKSPNGGSKKAVGGGKGIRASKSKRGNPSAIGQIPTASDTPVDCNNPDDPEYGKLRLVFSQVGEKQYRRGKKKSRKEKTKATTEVTGGDSTGVQMCGKVKVVAIKDQAQTIHEGETCGLVMKTTKKCSVHTPFVSGGDASTGKKKRKKHGDPFFGNERMNSLIGICYQYFICDDKAAGSSDDHSLSGSSDVGYSSGSDAETSSSGHTSTGSETSDSEYKPGHSSDNSDSGSDSDNQGLKKRKMTPPRRFKPAGRNAAGGAVRAAAPATGAATAANPTAPHDHGCDDAGACQTP